MGLEKNLVRTASDGSECLVCDKMIPTGDGCLEVSFNVSVTIFKTRISKLMHVDCAKELRDLLNTRIAEGERRKR